MIKYAFLTLTLCTLGACSSPSPYNLASQARDQGAQYNKIAANWESGNNILLQGKELIAQGQEQIGEGRSLMQTGENNKLKGYEMIRQGQSNMQQSETAFRQRTYPTVSQIRNNAY